MLVGEQQLLRHKEHETATPNATLAVANSTHTLHKQACLMCTSCSHCCVLLVLPFTLLPHTPVPACSKRLLTARARCCVCSWTTCVT